MQRLQVLTGQLENAAEVERSSSPAKGAPRMFANLPASQHMQKQAQRDDDAERKDSLRELTHRPYPAPPSHNNTSQQQLQYLSLEGACGNSVLMLISV